MAETNEVTHTVTVESEIGGMAVGQGFVWITLAESDSVLRIDPDTAEVVGQAIPVGKVPQGIALGPRVVWVANQGSNTVTRIDLDAEL